MHGNAVSDGDHARYSSGVTGFALERVKNFASCPKATLDVSNVFQVGVRMKRALNP